MENLKTLLYGNHIMIFHTERDKYSTFEKWDEIISAMSMAEVRSKKIEAVKDNEWNKAVHWRQIEKLKLNERL